MAYGLYEMAIMILQSKIFLEIQSKKRVRIKNKLSCVTRGYTFFMHLFWNFDTHLHNMHLKDATMQKRELT